MVTWNDYPEGHAVCPDLNKNFAFSTLLKYLSNEWKGNPELNDREIGWVFYKKYPSSAKPSVADFEVRSELGIPLVGVVDTNHSPEGIGYVIPGNDDSAKAVDLYARVIADAIIEGRANAIDEVARAVVANEGTDEFVEVQETAA